VAWRWHHLAITMKKTDTDPARDGDLQQVRHLLQPSRARQGDGVMKLAIRP
jgi:hypothetical protein